MIEPFKFLITISGITTPTTHAYGTFITYAYFSVGISSPRYTFSSGEVCHPILSPTPIYPSSTSSPASKSYSLAKLGGIPMASTTWHRLLLGTLAWSRPPPNMSGSSERPYIHHTLCGLVRARTQSPFPRTGASTDCSVT